MDESQCDIYGTSMYANTYCYHPERRFRLLQRLCLRVLHCLDCLADDPQRSPAYQEMHTVAVEYYKLLETGDHASPEQKVELKRELDRLTAPWSDNVAYHVFLEMRRMAAFGE